MRRIVRLLVAGWLLVFAAVPLKGMTWQELLTEIDAVEAGATGNPQIILRFSEIVQMLVTYSRAVHETDPAARLMCPPQGSPMHIDEIVSMVRSEARNSGASPNSDVQTLMLNSFRKRYPCT